MRRIVAFLRGLFEFKTEFTRHYDYPLIVWYDRGRELAHRLTFRRFEQ